MADTTGISDMGNSWAWDLPFSLVIRIIFFDSFFDGAKGIEGVTELSTKISSSLTLDFLESDDLISLVLISSSSFLLVKILSNTHFSNFLFW